MLSETLQLACTDATPQFFGLFDTSVAPPLLFYAYIPIALISLVVGIFIFIKDVKGRSNRLFFLLAASFTLFIFNETQLWISVPAALVYFGWSLSLLLLLYIHFFSFYFAYSFVYGRDMTPFVKVVIFCIASPVILLLPTKFNVSIFDLDACEGITGGLWYYYYFVSCLTVTALIGLTLTTIFHRIKVQDRSSKKQSVYLLVATAVFLTIFSASYSFGEITGAFEINLVGPIGMLFFIGVLAYLIVQYQAFDIKLAATQALVATLIIIIGSQFFFVESSVNQVLVGVTFTIACIGGYFLVKSVMREIKQREQIERLAKDLAKANKRLRELDQLKTEFVSIASHQLRSPLTAIRGYASMLVDGDFGTFPEKARDALMRIDESSRFMAISIDDFLNVSRIESGSMKYEISNFSLADEISRLVDDLRPAAVKRGLVLTYSSKAETDTHVSADVGKLRQVVQNVIDNAMKYTPKGKITVTVADDAKAKKVRIIVQDTGIGMSEETAAKLFGKFVRASNANTVNVHGTGLGLYLAKQMLEAMHGTITASSEGDGKGSTFTIELPLAH